MYRKLFLEHNSRCKQGKTTHHFCARLGHSDLHLLCAAAVARWAKFDLHGFLILLLTLEAVCHRLDRPHPLLPKPEERPRSPQQISNGVLQKRLMHSGVNFNFCSSVTTGNLNAWEGKKKKKKRVRWLMKFRFLCVLFGRGLWGFSPWQRWGKQNSMAIAAVWCA